MLGDRKLRGSNPTSASRRPLSGLGQPGSIPLLVLPSGGMAAKHRKGVTAEQRYANFGMRGAKCIQLEWFQGLLGCTILMITKMDESRATMSFKLFTFNSTGVQIMEDPNQTFVNICLLMAFDSHLSRFFGEKMNLLWIHLDAIRSQDRHHIIIIIDSMTSVFNTDASMPFNHDLFGSLIVKNRIKVDGGGT
ncbi:hypothetical protein CSKR_108023 [Clonorchis sinensis]|uniref:Uncharacterized protein n=1 Tax=Clonorchis sinensis TaxID=79923 RepID=A0A3R7H685_CLOSI|nr:hypothetical protein CSKR_108023 [Clonorchis sinensis]